MPLSNLFFRNIIIPYAWSRSLDCPSGSDGHVPFSGHDHSNRHFMTPIFSKQALTRLLFLPTILLLQLLQPGLHAQSVEITFDSDAGSTVPNHFRFDRSGLTVADRDLRIEGSAGETLIVNSSAFALSDDNRYLGVIHPEGQVVVTLFDGFGMPVRHTRLEHADPSDRTFGIQMFNDGRFLVRDNVANFTLYNFDGTVSYNYFNSSGSAEGEVISEALTDPFGRTLLLYIPRINYGDSEGSLARIVTGEEHAIELFQSRERQISFAALCRYGSRVVLLTTRQETAPAVHVLDRFGNEIAKLESDEALIGASLSDDGEYLTAWSERRVQIYRISDLERQGSASVRQSLVYAGYSPLDRQIVLLTGRTDRERRISEAEVQVVDLEHRAIAGSEVGSTLSYLERDRIAVTRRSASQFEIKGLNRTLLIRPRF